MSDWLHNLPILGMALIIFAATYLAALGIYALVALLARGERARSLKAFSSGMLAPLCIIFGLFVAFTAAQVWGDSERATSAVNQEAAALRAVQVYAASFPPETRQRLSGLVRDYIQDVVSREWPLMARRSATFGSVPAQLSQAMDMDLALQPATPGQAIAQREIATALRNAIDAHRQRIIVSESQVNAVKWSCLVVQALCALLAIAVAHSGERLASAVALGLFASGVAACILLIAAHDRPFTGEISVSPAPLIRVMPHD
jgi:hypothetical protein